MKIVSWNCNGKFREKYKELLKLDCDVYIIQECENPILTKNKDYEKFASNFVYIEHSKHKGLGIFAKNNIKLKNNNWNSYGLECFCSVNINDIYDVIGVWCCGNYIEDYYVWQEIYKNKFHKNTIIFGDFNSNSIWDNLHDKRNHTQVVLNLNELGFDSIYHYLKKEKQGKETMPTFFQYRHLDKPYHIDYLTYKNIPKAKSQPEAILFYYIHKYIDKEVKVNEFRIGKFVADIYFNFNNIKYVIEFDSLSYHSSKEDIEKDLEKNKIFKENGIEVIRLRNYTRTKSLPNLKDCKNIKCNFNYFKSKKELIEDTQTLYEIFNYIGIEHNDFSLINDLPFIKLEPYWIW